MGLKWTAFLRLKGEARSEKKEGIPAQVIGLVQFLQSVSTRYSLVFLIENEGSRMVHPIDSELSFEAWARSEESDS